MDEETILRVTAAGTNAKLQSHTPHLLACEPENGVDAHGIQAYYTGLVAKEAHLVLATRVEDGRVTLEAVPDGSAVPAHDSGMIGMAAVQQVA